MRIILLSLSLLAAIGLPAQANALCRGSNIGTGYIVAYGDCHSSYNVDYPDPQNICEHASNSNEPNPLIISDVFYYEVDATRRGTALSMFLDEVTIQTRIDALPDSATVCYETRRQAEDYRRRIMSRAVRADRQVSIVFIENRHRR